MTTFSTYPVDSSAECRDRDGVIVLRDATMNDFGQYLPMVKCILTGGTFSKVRLDLERARSSVHQWLVDPSRFVQVAELNSRPVGILIGYVGRQWFSSDLTGHDTLLLVEPSHRTIGVGSALVNSFVEWCGVKGAVLVFLSSSIGIATDAARKVYEKAGFHHCGPIYLKEIGNV